MSGVPLNVLVETKKEYMEQIYDLFTNPFYQGIVSIWKKSKTLYEAELDYQKKLRPRDRKKISLLMIFQKKLEDIPNWSEEIINNEYNRIKEITGWPNFDRLILAILTTRSNILETISLDSKKQKYELTIPSSKHFIHCCYMQIARNIFEFPYLLEDRRQLINHIEMQQNMRLTKDLIQKSIDKTIREMLPVRQIIDAYLNQDKIDELNNNNNNNTTQYESFSNSTNLSLSESGFSDTYTVQPDLDRLSYKKEVKSIDDTKLSYKGEEFLSSGKLSSGSHKLSMKPNLNVEPELEPEPEPEPEFKPQLSSKETKELETLSNKLKSEIEKGEIFEHKKSHDHDRDYDRDRDHHHDHDDDYEPTIDSDSDSDKDEIKRVRIPSNGKKSNRTPPKPEFIEDSD